MLKDNLSIKLHKDKSYDCGYKVHYMNVLRGLLKRILNEKKQDYKLKGEVEAKLTKLWTNKHRDLKTQDKHKVKMTAAELAAVEVIQNWYKRKRNLVAEKPQQNQKKKEEVHPIKIAMRELAQARADNR